MLPQSCEKLIGPLAIMTYVCIGPEANGALAYLAGSYSRVIAAMLKTEPLALLLLVLLSSPLLAQDTVIRIEEEWELQLNTPNSFRGSPQIETVLAPTGSAEGITARFLINKRTSFDAQVGGLQMQIMQGNVVLAAADLSEVALNTPGEKVLWTQRLSLNKGLLTFEILNGSSVTWGKFPGKADFSLSVQTNLTNLNGYHPNVTAAESNVDFGQPRVNKLILRKARTYTNNGKSIERADSRVIYQYQ